MSATDRALVAIRAVAFRLPEFTTDDVWAKLKTSLDAEPRTLGFALLQAAKLRWIVKTDRMRPSGRRQQHRRPITIWQSRLYHRSKSRRPKPNGHDASATSMERPAAATPPAGGKDETP
jgi:hypothetical protein